MKRYFKEINQRKNYLLRIWSILYIFVSCILVYPTDYIFTKNNSPYYIDTSCDFLLNENDIFIIEAGVEITLQEGVSFFVRHGLASAQYATISIVGDSLNPILISGEGTGATVYITLAHENKIEYVQFKNVTGFSDEPVIDTKIDTIRHLSFKNCRQCLIVRTPDQLYNNIISKVIEDCIFENIHGMYGIYFQLEWDPIKRIIMENNSFVNVTVPLFDNFSYSIRPGINDYFLFRNNEIRNSSTSMSLPNMDEIVLANNLFCDNSAFQISCTNDHDLGDEAGQHIVILNNVFFNNRNIHALLWLECREVSVCNSIFWNNSTTDKIVIEVHDNIHPNEYLNSYTDLEVKNCILPGKETACQTGKGSVYYSDLYEFDPVFTEKFHLSSNSPAVNAGLETPYMNDQDGTRNDLGIFGGNAFIIFPGEIDFGTQFGDMVVDVAYVNLVNLLRGTILKPENIYLLLGFGIRLENQNIPDGLSYASANAVSVVLESGPRKILDTLIIDMGTYGAFKEAHIPIKADIHSVLSGMIKGRLTTEESPYALGHATVLRGDTLIIDSGVKIKSWYGSSLKVLGTLLCGSESGPDVKFEDYYESLLFLNFEGGSGTFSNVDISGFGSSYALIAVSDGGQVKLKNINYTNCNFESLFYLDGQARLEIDTGEIDLEKHRGMTVGEVYDNSSALIQNCHFYSAHHYLNYIVKSRANSQVRVFKCKFDGFNVASLIEARESRTVFWNNLVVNSDINSYLMDTDSDIYFVNNTVYDVMHKNPNPDFNFCLNTETGVKILRNNIYYPSNTYSGFVRGYSYYGGYYYRIHIDHNMVKGGDSLVFIDSDTYKKYSLIYHNYGDAPIFQADDTSRYGYRLDENSPGINQGHDHPSYYDSDGSINDLGAYGGTGRIPPVLQYNAFWHLQVTSLNWIIETVFKEDPFAWKGVNLWNEDQSEIIKSFQLEEVYPEIAVVQLLIPGKGTYYLEHMYSQYDIQISELVMLIIGTPEADIKKLPGPAVLSLTSADPQQKSPAFVAWKIDENTFKIKIDDTFDWQINRQVIQFQVLQEEVACDIIFVSDSSGQEQILTTKTAGDYYQAEFHGTGLYRLVKHDQQQIKILDLTYREPRVCIFPNPFNAYTAVRIELNEECDITVSVYDPLGRKVATLVKGKKTEGVHQIMFDAGHLASGVYYVVLKTSEFIQTSKILLIK